jgi:hypothetical protein
MRIAYFPKYIALNAAPVLDAFLQGCRRHGIMVEENSMTADAAVIWSQLWSGRMMPNRDVWTAYQSRRAPVFVLEVGALRRNHTWRLLLNGENCIYQHGHDDARGRSLGLRCDPWKSHGHEIIVCLQRQDSQQWHGMPDPRSWAQDIVSQLEKYTDRPIRIRCHPRQRIDFGVLSQFPQAIPNTYDDFDFESSIDHAWAVVNWNSGPGTQATILGVPAFVSPRSIAAPVANIDLSLIETPARPDRTQWLNDLAHTEYFIEEIQQGLAWNYISHLVPRP